MAREDYYWILQRPLITEKSTWLKEKFNQYVFRVHADATRNQIKQAVETLFKVEVEKVRTATMPGKMRRLGRFVGKRSDWKKAFVRVKSGQKIDLASEAGG
ncbi:MAG: 50S ribosomal protein L23 [Elusimicrobia bacterium RIFCSPLOWO2_12_FULL_59_9]|nr:50S ribosomal protein L23 [Elusimicrobiota bacterium]OGS05752.1 MAG: 50S ribosomal protein L23 [Elusimicrobia bacterium RIFCSPLOWO2_12_FULL_59_9]